MTKGLGKVIVVGVLSKGCQLTTGHIVSQFLDLRQEWMSEQISSMKS
jgi:hypothetical protein